MCTYKYVENTKTGHEVWRAVTLSPSLLQRDFIYEEGASIYVEGAGAQ